MKKTILLVFFILLHLPVFSQWKEFKTGPYHFTDLVWADSMTAYGTEGDMVLYRTTDHGKSWKKIEIAPNLNYSSMCFLSPAIGYVISYDAYPDTLREGLYSTEDSGNTWKKISGVTGAEIHFFNRAKGFFIFNEAQLIYTADSGRT